MLDYIYGKIVYIGKQYLIIENNFNGYKVHINNTEKYELNKYTKVFIYKYLKLNKNFIEELFYGFNNLIERNFFNDLILINGIGVITANNILKNDLNLLIELIANNNYEALSELNYINEKNAKLICSELSKKYSLLLNNNQIAKNNVNNDLIFALKQLGYSKEDINYALSKCDLSLPLNDLINNSIKAIAINNQNLNNA